LDAFIYCSRRFTGWCFPTDEEGVLRKLGRYGLVAAVTAAIVAGASLAAAVSALGGSAQQQKALVPVTAGKPTEFRFTIPVLKRTVPKGVTTFTVTNRGTVNHDFKILGKKTLQIAPGKSRVLTVTFTKAGKYTYICTLPSHALSGMKGILTVR
jgi:uncharacterized cupredoxin-like copper-binding protein